MRLAPRHRPGQDVRRGWGSLRRLPARLLLAPGRDVVRRLEMAGHRQRMGERALALRALEPLDAPALADRSARADRAGDRDHAIPGAGERATQLLDEPSLVPGQLLGLRSETVLFAKQPIEGLEQGV